MKFLEKMRGDYAETTEPDWEGLKSSSCHPGVIGRTPEDVAPPFGREKTDAPMYFLHCGCGMLTGTSKDYSGRGTTCMNCAGNTSTPSASAPDSQGTMSPRVERHIRYGLIAFVLLAVVMVGTSVSNGGSRPEPPMRALD